jgi:molybdenum ABC transporter molybdate-binding protein
MFPSPPRPGRLNGPWLTFLGSVAALAVLIGALSWETIARWLQGLRRPAPVVVYCAAGIRAPVEAAAKEYERRYRVPIQVQYGGSQTLLANIQASGRGDLYLAADESYMTLAHEQGLIAETVPLAKMRPVLVVAKGNPKKVRSLEDLLARRLRVVQANPEAAAIGKVARDALRKSGQWAAFKKCVVSDKMTVNDVANDVQLGSADAGIVWDATLHLVPGLEVVDAPALNNLSSDISIGVLTACEQPAAALAFARFLGARDEGGPLFAANGFTPAEGDEWEQRPELLLHAGAMLRPALEPTLTAFEEREGVTVTRVYNGCGILVAGMKASKKERLPDVYFACDQEFMDQVKDLFGPQTTVSTNELVILVRKGNPHRIRRLRDLGKPGLKVGIGHEKQCAMGVLTQRTLNRTKARPDVMPNVVVQSPTGDMLVNQMRARSLDAAVAYISNAAGAEKELEAIPIDIDCAVASQPFAIGKESKHKLTAGRLLDAIRRADSRKRFEALGFKWKLGGR